MDPVDAADPGHSSGERMDAADDPPRPRAETDAEKASASEGEDLEDDEGRDVNKHVYVGFTAPVQDAEERALLGSARMFASKVGGRPAWLVPEADKIPSASSLVCESCSGADGLDTDLEREPMRMLLQIYAPLDDAAFHRILYLFVCRRAGCQRGRGSFKVFRQQLPRRNPFYAFDYEPPSVQDVLAENQQREGRNVHLCCVCGILARSKCALCKRAWYCSKFCQLDDWKRLGHKELCGKEADPQSSCKDARAEILSERLFPLLRIEVEQAFSALPLASAAPVGTMQDADDNEFLNKEEAKSHSAPSRDAESNQASKNNDVGAQATPIAADSHMVRFQQAVESDPDQAIRYYSWSSIDNEDKDGPDVYPVEPLWMHTEHVLNFLPPACERCTGSRRLEFQVMPQLIYFIEESVELPEKRSEDEHDQVLCTNAEEDPDASQQAALYSMASALSKQGVIEFGTLVVYTCANSCTGDGLAPEYVFHQPPPSHLPF
ncbi:Programmed cell death protein 2 [Porphyridium purpureum]|uniref:Programmed cell death protein 2 n=1 Tax=Porphyridium purpureum TaxID=35688 RepID=A0A5J4Z0Q3_PORPP|nr:Programmed cell death protein 2 [Porphyridium purpureum]|eukprot:POR6202..scf208_2